MTSNQPYMIRAFYDWIVDNNMTPYIVVNANYPGTMVPQEHVKDGQIVLNVSPSACGKLELGNVDISFEARFGGVPRQLNVPCKAVLAIYSRENGAGTVFTLEDELDAESGEMETFEEAPIATPEEKPVEQATPPKKGRPNLTVVK